MSTPLQNTDSGKHTDKPLPGFYFPTDVNGNVLPLFSGGRPSRPRSTLLAHEIVPAGMDLPGPKVMTERTVVHANADLKVSDLSHPSPSIQQHRPARAQNAPSPFLTLTQAMQQPEPPHQAPLFPCDATGAVLPLFHPSTTTSSLPRSQSTTTTLSSDNSPTPLPCDASGAALGLSGQWVTAGSRNSVPAVALGDCDEGEEDEEDSAESVIEWIDEMLSGCGVVGEGSGRKEGRKRGGRGRDAREVLEWLEELKFEF
ncbi:hypothetical protein B9Z19DRAFT_1118896 [Tuber borchii]|uniref:Uncharacterized protein n=1 Tax=Tuber borchii TaxID=42251 RepID=A0A2T7A787_TUBBO|nr:hypothetical protein B9Z19DRAFT_1118896 [Tuber borchii]